MKGLLYCLGLSYSKTSDRVYSILSELVPSFSFYAERTLWYLHTQQNKFHFHFNLKKKGLNGIYFYSIRSKRKGRSLLKEGASAL